MYQEAALQKWPVADLVDSAEATSTGTKTANMPKKDIDKLRLKQLVLMQQR
jgi:hypothetical protein